MNIVYSSSDSYAPIAGVSIYSLLCNHEDCDKLHLYIIDNQISLHNKHRLETLCAQFDRPVDFIPIADIERLVGKSIDIGRWNISTFGRLFLASLLPEDVEKVIHIDCDTIVTDSLLPLWNMDMGTQVVAGVLECIGDNYKKELGLSPQDIYINAGNIMLNLAQIRKMNLEQRFIRFIRTHRQLSFVDQAVLNACVPNEQKMVVPLRYNCYSIVYYLKYKNLKRAKKVTSYYSEQQVADAIRDPAIVHFTTCFMDGSRPWIENNRHPLLSDYQAYKQASPWRDEPLWKDPRGVLKRIMYGLFRILPQGFVCAVIGFIHATIIPLKHRIQK